MSLFVCLALCAATNKVWDTQFPLRYFKFHQEFHLEIQCIKISETGETKMMPAPSYLLTFLTKFYFAAD